MQNVLQKQHNYPYLMPEWYIREANEGDAEKLYTYLQLIANETTNNTHWRQGSVPVSVEDARYLIRQYVRGETSNILIAMVGDEIAGALFSKGGDDLFTSHLIELSINVREDFRGQGIGSGLLQQIMAWARSKNTIHRVQLEVLTRNEGAIRLYRRHGFITEGRRYMSYLLYDEGRDTYEDTLMMARYL